jgi:hypothetical protein
MSNPYKLSLGEWMYYPGVNYYVMGMNGLCICDTYIEAMELVSEALSYTDILSWR